MVAVINIIFVGLFGEILPSSSSCSSIYTDNAYNTNNADNADNVDNVHNAESEINADNVENADNADCVENADRQQFRQTDNQGRLSQGQVCNSCNVFYVQHRSHRINLG